MRHLSLDRGALLENMAHVTLGEHGPSGLKLPAGVVLSDSFSYDLMRIPTQK